MTCDKVIYFIFYFIIIHSLVVMGNRGWFLQVLTWELRNPETNHLVPYTIRHWLPTLPQSMTLYKCISDSIKYNSYLHMEMCLGETGSLCTPGYCHLNHENLSHPTCQIFTLKWPVFRPVNAIHIRLSNILPLSNIIFTIFSVLTINKDSSI